MNCINTLYIIASFLDLQALARFASINKLFYKISQKSALWKALMWKEYFQDYNSFGYISFSDISRGLFWRKLLQDEPNWKILLKKRVELRRIPKTLPYGSTFKASFGRLLSSIFNAFSCPEIPLPKLYREFQSFPTLYQNLLALEIQNEQISTFDSVDNETFEGILNELKLDNCSSVFLSIFTEYQPFTLISDSSYCVELFIYEPGGWFGVLAKVIKSLIFCHCQATLASLRVVPEGQELVAEYVQRWEAYAATMHQICGLMSALCCRMEGGSSTYSDHWVFVMASEMRKIWKLEVFSQIKTELHEIILNLFQIQRKRMVNQLIRSDNLDRNYGPIEILLQQAVLIIADLGLDKNTLCYLKHSSFLSDTYSDLHKAFKSQCEGLYSELENSDLSTSNAYFEADSILTEQIWLPCTVSQLEQLRKKSELRLREKIFLHDFSSMTESSPYLDAFSPYLQTSFCKFLKENGKSTKNILGFLRLLESQNRLNEVNEYNKGVSSMKQKNGFELQDLGIELMSKRLGVIYKELQGIE